MSANKERIEVVVCIFFISGKIAVPLRRRLWDVEGAPADLDIANDGSMSSTDEGVSRISRDARTRLKS